MIRKIIQKGNLILEEKAKALDLVKQQEECLSLIEDLTDTINHTLTTHPFSKGIGLNAPQIGISKQIFAIKMPGEKISFFVNPKIIWYSKKIDCKYEGCLSFFKFRGKVKRSTGIKLEYFDINFNIQRKKFKDGTARLIQHEYDHLQGIFYISRTPKG